MPLRRLVTDAPEQGNGDCANPANSPFGDHNPKSAFGFIRPVRERHLRAFHKADAVYLGLLSSLGIKPQLTGSPGLALQEDSCVPPCRGWSQRRWKRARVGFLLRPKNTAGFEQRSGTRRKPCLVSARQLVSNPCCTQHSGCRHMRACTSPPPSITLDLS